MAIYKSNGDRVPDHIRDMAAKARAGEVDRREFLALASIFGASTAMAYGMLGLAAPTPAKADEVQGKKGGVIKVAMSVKVYSVQLKDGDNYGADINLLFQNAGKYGLRFATTGSLPAPVTAIGQVPAPSSGQNQGIGWAILDPSLNTQGSGLVQALSTRGDVSVVTSASVTTSTGFCLARISPAASRRKRGITSRLAASRRMASSRSWSCRVKIIRDRIRRGSAGGRRRASRCRR